MWHISVVGIAVIFALCTNFSVAESSACKVDFSRYQGPFYYANANLKARPSVPYNEIDFAKAKTLKAYYVVYRLGERVVFFEKRLDGRTWWSDHYFYRDGSLIVEKEVSGVCSVLEYKITD